MLSGVTDTYSYDRNDKLTSTSSKSFYYNSNGKCTSVVVGGNKTSLTWNDANLCTGITYPNASTNSFSYNGENLRVSKVDSAGTTTSITDGTSPASAVIKDSIAVYTPGISERASTTSKYYQVDALGSTRGITNGSQTVTDAILYDAYGMTVSRTGTTATPFGFVGAVQYQSDGDSGLQLLGNRMYDPSIGRFISADPIQDGSNWYSYTQNNPTINIDPDGLSFGKWIAGKVAGWIERRAAREAAVKAAELAERTKQMLAMFEKAEEERLAREGSAFVRRLAREREIKELMARQGRELEARQEAIRQQRERDKDQRTPPGGPDIGGLVGILDPTPISDIIALIKDNKGNVDRWIRDQQARAKRHYGLDP